MAGLSTSCVLMEFEQMEILNKVLYTGNIGEFSSEDGSIFDSDYA
jgi:hypothetical protein